jgi:hypothetical protein
MDRFIINPNDDDTVESSIMSDEEDLEGVGSLGSINITKYFVYFVVLMDPSLPNKYTTGCIR